ncbi:MAG TPA: hypothetical protein VHC90_08120 [Bryobacteraceae bacterium]|nr:hypothetical protein [Bryobacteraceae bacterium]
MNGRIIHRITGIAVLAVVLWPASLATAQKNPKPEAVVGPTPIQAVEQPDAERVKQELSDLLQRYPPSLRSVLRQDPSLMTNQQYMATFPALSAYLNQHPEIPRNPSFYVGTPGPEFGPRTPDERTFDIWNRLLQALTIFAGFGMAIGLLTWLIRTFMDYRRWNRLSKVQAEVHTRLLDRFNTNEELMAYIATPAGSRFLSSAPISLDTGAASRSLGAPLSRIMLSLQAGVVLAAAGVGLMLSGQTVSLADAAEPLHILGLISISLGVGFAISAAASFLISKKLGLLEPPPQQRRISELPEMPQ